MSADKERDAARFFVVSALGPKRDPFLVNRIMAAAVGDSKWGRELPPDDGTPAPRS